MLIGLIPNNPSKGGEKMNKKIMLAILLSIIVTISLPVGVTLAEKPVEITSVMFLNAEIISISPKGVNVISERELVGSFTSGPLEGTIYREIRVVQHLAIGKASVQNIMYVEDAVVTVDGVVAEGSFVMKVVGLGGVNAKWTIIASELTVNGDPVKLHGEGSATITGFVPVDATHYSIENALFGQISLSP
jgi:hypothetical protein